MQFVHLAIDAWQQNFFFIFDAEVFEQIHLLFKLGIGHAKRASFGRVKKLGGMKAEHGGVTVLHDGLAIKLSAKCVRAVVNYFQRMRFCQAFYSIHIAGHAVHMHAQHSGSFGGQIVFNAVGVYAKCFGVDVCKYRRYIVPSQHMGRGSKGERRGDHFSHYFQRLAGHQQGQGPIIKKA